MKSNKTSQKGNGYFRAAYVLLAVAVCYAIIGLCVVGPKSVTAAQLNQGVGIFLALIGTATILVVFPLFLAKPVIKEKINYLDERIVNETLAAIHTAYRWKGFLLTVAILVVIALALGFSGSIFGF